MRIESKQAFLFLRIVLVLVLMYLPILYLPQEAAKDIKKATLVTGGTDERDNKVEPYRLVSKS